MAKLTKKNVLHVAKLANLTLTDEEVEKYLEQLSNIISYISQLDEVDVSELEPTSQTTGLENVLRIDELKPGNSLDLKYALSGTENTHNDYFQVDAVLEERSDPTTLKLRGASK